MDKWVLLVGALAVAVPVTIYFLQRRRKSLSYRVVTNTLLLPLDEAVISEAKDRLQILFDGAPVENVHLLELEILNDGNVPIPKADFERPLTFMLGTDTKILIETELVKVSDGSLKPTWGFTSNSFNIDPLLLNSKDSMVFKFLLDEFDGTIANDPRIVGGKVTRALTVGEQSKFLSVILLGFAVAILSALTFLLILESFLPYWGIDILGINPSILLTIIALTTILLYLLTGDRLWRRSR